MAMHGYRHMHVHAMLVRGRCSVGILHMAIPIGQFDLPDTPSPRKQTASVSIYGPVYGDSVVLAVAMAYQVCDFAGLLYGLVR